jgi:uncharacterized protein (TIGR03435 family)
LNWVCGNIQLAELIFLAYDLELYQAKYPAWADDTFVDVAARIPEGANRNQFRTMQQSLLVERFGLVFHREPRDGTIRVLSVSEGGLRMRESPAGAPSPETEWGRVRGATIGPDRYPVFPEGAQGLMGVNNHVRWKSSNITVDDIVKVLRRSVRTDVVDRTGLTGRYDVDIRWENEPFDTGPNPPPFNGPRVERALLDGLGLKLESRKGSISAFVVDRLEKSPTEN